MLGSDLNLFLGLSSKLDELDLAMPSCYTSGSWDSACFGDPCSQLCKQEESQAVWLQSPRPLTTGPLTFKGNWPIFMYKSFCTIIISLSGKHGHWIDVKENYEQNKAIWPLSGWILWSWQKWREVRKGSPGYICHFQEIVRNRWQEIEL